MRVYILKIELVKGIPTAYPNTAEPSHDDLLGTARRGRVAIGSLKFGRDPELIVYYSNILFIYICNAHLKLFRVSWSHTNGDPDIAALFLRQRRQKVVRPR